jgi:hypothetical protein
MRKELTRGFAAAEVEGDGRPMVARTAARRSKRRHTATKGEPRDVKYRFTDGLQLYLFELKGELVENQSKTSNENLFKFEFRLK